MKHSKNVLKMRTANSDSLLHASNFFKEIFIEKNFF